MRKRLTPKTFRIDKNYHKKNIPPQPPPPSPLDENHTQNPGKDGGGILHQSRGIISSCMRIYPPRDQISTQTCKSGGSGYGRDIFRVSREDALEILGYGSAEKIESEIFGITRKLKKDCTADSQRQRTTESVWLNLHRKNVVSPSSKNLPLR